MKIKLQEITIRALTEGYRNNAEDGVIGFGGKLDIRPKYQREFVYKDVQRNAVIETVRKNFPLNVMYWVENGDSYEVLDGQQRTISLCSYVDGDFSLEDKDGKIKYFHNLTADQQDQILDYKIMVYFCEGTDSEKLDWFKIINTAGVILKDQELRNAVYTGAWLTDAKRYFSRSNCGAYNLASDYMTGTPIHQDYLQTAISWVSDGAIEQYMADHQADLSASDLWLYFQSVINWVETTFQEKHNEMKSIDWGGLYKTYHTTAYSPSEINKKVQDLYDDPYVSAKKGIFEYVLGGCIDTKLLHIRVFAEATKRITYKKQTAIANSEDKSNCPHCAIGQNANSKKIWKLNEMEADHVTAWSNGGHTNIANCEMLCVTHNRAKGNR